MKTMMQILCLYSLLQLGTAEAQPCFSARATGLSYVVVITSVTIDGQALKNGDEIGVFDGNIGVGSAAYSGGGNLLINAWQGDPAQLIPGFVPGHPILFKVCDRNSGGFFVATAIFSAGNGTFGSGSFTAAGLTVLTNGRKPGDVRTDGVIDTLDVDMLLRHLLKMTPDLDENEKRNADMNADGQIDMQDLLRLVAFVYRQE